MGFFSWECEVCEKDIWNRHSAAAEKDPGLACAVMVTPDGKHVEPSYDGYGVFDFVDAYEWAGDGDRDAGINTAFEDGPPQDGRREIKILHCRCYTGQSYDSLKPSKDAQGQGYFGWGKS